MNDWTGNNRSIYTTLGASNHAEGIREEHDFYATEPKAVELLLDVESFAPEIWECACGMGHLSEVMKRRGHAVRSTDLIDRGYGESGVDFLKCDTAWHGDIITNPPYKFAQEFIEKALSLVGDGSKVAMFLKVQFLEGKKRKKLFQAFPPRTVHVSSSRLLCAKNGLFADIVNGRRIPKQGLISGSAVAYAWFVWEKGWRGDTTLKWFN
jgi:hypothetical protein